MAINQSQKRTPINFHKHKYIHKFKNLYLHLFFILYLYSFIFTFFHLNLNLFIFMKIYFVSNSLFFKTSQLLSFTFFSALKCHPYGWNLKFYFSALVVLPICFDGKVMLTRQVRRAQTAFSLLSKQSTEEETIDTHPSKWLLLMKVL